MIEFVAFCVGVIAGSGVVSAYYMQKIAWAIEDKARLAEQIKEETDPNCIHCYQIREGKFVKD